MENAARGIIAAPAALCDEGLPEGNGCVFARPPEPVELGETWQFGVASRR